MVEHPPSTFFTLTIILLLMEFHGMRYRVNRIIRYQGRRAIRNRRKGQSFKEWFLYLRYRDMFPTLSLWIYCSGMLYMGIMFLTALIFLISGNAEASRIVMAVAFGVWLFQAVVEHVANLGVSRDKLRTRERTTRLIFYLDGRLEKRRKRE